MKPAPMAAALGFAIDAIWGDPPNRWHPVAWFGSAMDTAERYTYADDRTSGFIYTSVGILGAATVGGALNITSLWTTVAIGGKGLDGAAAQIQHSLERGDLAEARSQLPWLVSRDPSSLDEPEVARAVVESVAENTVDAVIAPMFWAAALGTTGVVVHRAANTLDAMVGYHNERYENFGWASAKLDDALNYIPARLAVLLVCAVRPQRAAAVREVVLRDSPQHPSPNAGQIEAAFAAALGVQLGGNNTYGDHVESRGFLGDGPAPTTTTIAEARLLKRDVSVAFAMGCIAVGMLRRVISARARARP